MSRPNTLSTRRSVLAALVAAACATAPPSELPSGPLAEPSPGAPAGDQGASVEMRPELPPVEVSEALLPAFRVPPSSSEVSEEPRFDVAVHAADARNFFINLVQDTPYNIIVHPAVAGTISLTLKDATLPEILETVEQVYPYSFRATATGFYVFPAQLEQRTYQVDYLDIQRAGRSQTRVSSGQLSDQFSDAGSVSGGFIGPIATGAGARGRAVIEGSRVETDADRDFWKELAASLQAIIGTEAGRSVVVSPQAGIVVVRAMPAELRSVEDFLKRAQTNLQRQVILEAKILEVELNEGFRAGINWALVIGTTLLAAQTGGATLLGDVGVSDIAGNVGLLDPKNLSQVSNTDTSAFGGLLSLALNLNDFTAFIELLETQGKVHVLSSPRVSTVNNQKAVIKVGSDEFFVTDVSATTVTGTATTTTPQITLTPFFSGIALGVIPQIDENGDVILHVHPSVSEVVDQTKEITVGGETQSLPLAFSTVRESDSIVRARSGQMVVIGGLMREGMVKEQASVPVLGDIPYLGALFRQTRTTSRKSELVILLRPTVVGEGTWAEELRRVEERLQRPPYALDPKTFSPGEW